MRKKLISIRINPKIHKKAKEMGLNISNACEKCLEQQIQHLTNSNPKTDRISTPVRASQQPRLVGPPGFEPGSRKPKSQKN